MRQIKKLPKIPSRIPDTHKGDYGRVFVLAGSVGMTGAAYLCAKAVLRSGTGLVTLGIPESLNPIMASKLTCVMTRPLPETNAKTLSKDAKNVILDLIENYDVVVMGPGLSQHPDTKHLILQLLEQINKPIVLDADGINALVGNVDVLNRIKENIVLTPHPGEMARLVGLQSAGDVQKNRLEIARQFVKPRENVILVLKGFNTLVIDKNCYYINKTGNPGMATAGSGDVLTGMIGGLIGQAVGAGFKPALIGFEATQLSVYLHGFAGDIAAKEKGEISMIASDILDALPEAFLQYTR
ncbi:MAG TPA: NAD(P)H-hydrate dehydratase [Candidatus Brocadiia bacterium]|nr:NAD(P)H-hydrate dehydratase [Planctomycetota bacterium]MDO8093174.1 NAD(P)H-hydrate dehydratase [Candidatus Brocadiales bacterium]